MSERKMKGQLRVFFPDIGELDPADDVTPKEALKLAMMLASSTTIVIVDYPQFVKDNKLERHFKTNSAATNEARDG
jgi:hypothetical protein